MWIPTLAQLRRFGVLALCAAAGLALGHILPVASPAEVEASRRWILYGSLGLVVLMFVALAIYLLWNRYSGPVGSRLHRSWSRPPWDYPRTLSNAGSKRERADHWWLRERLDPAPDVEPPDPNDYLASATFVDRIAGRRWRMDRFEHGFNQWEVLTPLEEPTAEGSGKD